ncbi:hypothetical protein GT037_011156 [Alternaria burnsii]|uniref:Uncharacterized protein n=1 Tax=Alternaria burnsii TaxID=1187904 RepID=A0A8H7ASW5_9PLEO|nr:uncharacterized protein GT037_011156 [Alternaria burnsii]KAF7670705.1 hypothetical protein GT037_011156 [Alternaria burnsii]
MARSKKQTNPSSDPKAKTVRSVRSFVLDEDCNPQERGAAEETIRDNEDPKETKIDVFDDCDCIILSANVKFCQLRMDKIERHINNSKRKPDIIAIQDPPTKLAYRKFPSYNIHWRAEDNEDGQAQEMTAEDHPNHLAYQPPYESRRERPERNKITGGQKKLSKVAFLIHRSIIGVELDEPAPGTPNRGRVATLHVDTGQGSLAIHNALISRAIVPAINEFVPTIEVFAHEPQEPSSIPTTPAQKNRAWRRAVTKWTHSRQGVFRTAKRARSWGLPRQLDFTPDFDIGRGPIKSNRDKAECYVDSIWTKWEYKGPPKNSQPNTTSSESSDHPSMPRTSKPHFPLPHINLDKDTRDMTQRIVEGEVKKL